MEWSSGHERLEKARAGGLKMLKEEAPEHN
jgi:hypothetical protein